MLLLRLPSFDRRIGVSFPGRVAGRYSEYTNKDQCPVFSPPIEKRKVKHNLFHVKILRSAGASLGMTV